MTAPYAGPAVHRACPECGFRREYHTPGLAHRHFPKHSCAHQAKLQARAQRVQDRLTDPGIRRDCTCKQASHQHGSSEAYKIDLCRCRECRVAHRTAAARRDRALAYGTWDSGRIPVGPVREHLQMLINSGVSDRTIARVSGVSRSTIQVILQGRSDRGGQTNKTTTEGVAQRIQAVTPSMEILPDLAKIDATGTRRRLQALVALGWPQNHIGEQLSISASNFKTLLDQPRVTVVKAKRVRDLYERLWDTVPMAGNENEATVIKRARKMAATRGWLPPLAWDDESIDDPSAEPEAGDTKKKGEALVEDVEFLVPTGATTEEIALRIGKAWPSIERQLHRFARSDLIAAAKNDQRDNGRRDRKGAAA